MSISDKFSLGLSTTIIGMGIVFLVLIALWVIIVLEHKIIESIRAINKNDKQEAAPEQNPISEASTGKNGESVGESVIEGVEDDETAAVIMATVSDYTNIPMSELKITYVKAI
jgi:Na+-transporting methylmalonyl-CoA/oxaloacetate decarboxylase gamma subunit